MKLKNLVICFAFLFMVPAFADDIYVLYQVPQPNTFSVNTVAMYPYPHTCPNGWGAIWQPTSVVAQPSVSSGVNGAIPITWTFQNYTPGWCLTGNTPTQITSATLSTVSSQGVASYQGGEGGTPFSMAVDMTVFTNTTLSTPINTYSFIRCLPFPQGQFACCYSTDQENGCAPSQFKK